MGSVGDCYDNALAESFFATLECELLQRSCFQSQVQAKRALFEYIEGWYNLHRHHSRLGQKSPMEFEKCHPQVISNSAMSLKGERAPEASGGMDTDTMGSLNKGR